MFATLARTLFGSANDRSLKAHQRRVPDVAALEPAMQALDDAALAAKTAEFRTRIAAGAGLDELLPEAFAVVREASRRVLGLRHFDVQMVGGMVLHSGRIAEMRTGEGKTLVGTLPVYLNALSGRGVHVVTVNDYLARRDSEDMGRLYAFLGLSTGVIVPGIGDDERRAAYAADVTYGTNNEFGFDYLRDNMKYRLEDMVQRPFNYAIVDEVDSILIDEARTPLIISGPAEDSSDLYRRVDAVVADMVKDATTYDKDEKFRTVILTEHGTETVEAMLRDAGIVTEGGLYDVSNVSVVHHVQQSLRAHTLFSRDVDYIVRAGKVVIIDEFTGRMMEGRRYGDGLHQALEAKEHQEIQQENQTLASITFQNYFRLYPKLSGMTGTAMTEADEFAEIYKLDAVEIPTNVPVIRQDGDDEVYLSEADKFEAVTSLIEEVNKTGQPILVGTTSIEKSEHLSGLLKGRGIRHSVLNARFHEMEATIVAQAGAPGAITIATNMAGRGTDIKLGGNVEMRVRQELLELGEPERSAREAALREQVAAWHDVVTEAGGLFVIGTERHESRRIDNQLARPLRPPGRSRRIAVLPQPAGRPDAHLRLRPHGRDAAEDGAEAGRGDHPSLDQPRAGEGAEEGRGAQLRHPQEPAEVRRRQQQPAQGGLRAAQGVHVVGGRVGHRRHHAGRADRSHGPRPHPGKVVRRAVAERRARRRLRACAGTRPARPRLGHRGRHRPGRRDPAGAAGRRAVGCREGRQFRPNGDALHREAASAEHARHRLEGAPAAARPAPPGHLAARLRAEGSAQRVQERGLHAVQRHARRAARAGDRDPGPRRGDAAGRRPVPGRRRRPWPPRRCRRPSRRSRMR